MQLMHPTVARMLAPFAPPNSEVHRIARGMPQSLPELVTQAERDALMEVYASDGELAPDFEWTEVDRISSDRAYDRMKGDPQALADHAARRDRFHEIPGFLGKVAG